MRSVLSFLFLLAITHLGFAENHEKSPQATEQIKGEFGNYSLWIDPNQWKLIKKYPKQDEEDLIFCLAESFVYGNFRSKKVETNTETLEELKEWFMNRVLNIAPNVQVINEEFRVVNGSKVIYLQLLAKLDAVTPVFDAYLYMGDKYKVIVSTICNREFYNKYRKEIGDFLDGFVPDEW